jgi:hypothetical protein
VRRASPHRLPVCGDTDVPATGPQGCIQDIIPAQLAEREQMDHDSHGMLSAWLHHPDGQALLTEKLPSCPPRRNDALEGDSLPTATVDESVEADGNGQKSVKDIVREMIKHCNAAAGVQYRPRPPLLLSCHPTNTGDAGSPRAGGVALAPQQPPRQGSVDPAPLTARRRSRSISLDLGRGGAKTDHGQDDGQMNFRYIPIPERRYDFFINHCRACALGPL